jgi:dUTP pyrophosphatase
MGGGRLMDIKFKKLDEKAVIPTKAHTWDACYDLTAVSLKLDIDKNFVQYDTKLALEIPRGFAGLIYPRSSVSNYTLALCNSIAVIDSPYRGSILLRFRIVRAQNQELKIYSVGDRIGQLFIVPTLSVNFIEVNELDETDRGSGNFGSSGV